MSTQPEQTIWIARHGTRIDMIETNWKATAERPFDPHLADEGLAPIEIAQQLSEGVGKVELILALRDN